MRRDPLTKQLFVPTRTNQVFASAENRVKYHNQNASMLRKRKSFVDRPLYINHKILIEIMSGKDEAIFHKEFLMGKGFNFALHTHIDTVSESKYYAVYEFIIIVLKDEKIKILKKI
jgi:hypothetical protein